MGVDIGVCKYIPKREYKIKKLRLLTKLPEGDENRKAREELQKLFDEEIHVECEELQNKKIPELDYIGQRMFNLWWEINTHTIEIEFSFYKLYSDIRVIPEEIKNIIHDIKLLHPSADKEMKKSMEKQLLFFEYLVKNNLMIYPN
jgi:hypothetical protein